MHVTKLAELRKQRSAALDLVEPLAAKVNLTAEEAKAYKEGMESVDAIDAAIERTKAVQAAAAKSAVPVAGQHNAPVPAQAKGADPYINDPSLVVGGVVRMIAASRDGRAPGAHAEKQYGAQHPVTKALGEDTGAGGGYLVQPDFYPAVIELLRAKAVVRSAGAISLPMTRGTMTLPAQTSAASASYSGESKAIATTQPGVGQRVASAKDLTALVPISNDLLRDATGSVAVDAFVRDDLVRVIALREDLAFLLGDGTGLSPRGMLSIAQAYQTNVLTDTAGAGFTLATVNSLLGQAETALLNANVPIEKPCWFINPTIRGYLYNVLNEFGEYVFRAQMDLGKINNMPFKISTQIPKTTQYGGLNTSWIILAEMTEALVLDTQQLELAVRTEASYVDSAGTQQNAFANNQTLIRAVSRHDFAMRHDASVVVIQGAAWN